MAGAGQPINDLQIQQGPVTTGYRAEDTLSALAQLQQAYQQGIVSARDILDLAARPAETRARIASARDTEGAARANAQIRPAATADALGEFEQRAQLRPKVTALKAAELDSGVADARFRESIRPRAEALKVGELDEAAFEQGVKTRTRPARASTAEDTAEAGAVTARSARELASGEVDIAKQKQGVEKSDPYGVRRAVIAELTKAGVDFDPVNESDSDLRKKLREVRKAAKESELDYERAKAGVIEGPKRAEGLRKELEGNGTLGEYRTAMTALDGLEKTLSSDKPSGARDLSAIYQYVKILDPGSVVREGEIKLSQSAIPGLDRIAVAYNRITKGELLDENTRKEYLATARDLMASKEVAARSALAPYVESARAQGIDLKQVLGKREAALLDAKAAPAGAGAGQSVAAPKASMGAGQAAQIPPGARVFTHTDGTKHLMDTAGNYIGPLQ